MRHVTALLLNGLRAYKGEPSEWPAVRYSPLAGMPEIDVEAWTGQLGLEPTVEMFVGHLVHVFRLVWRVLRDDGTLFLNLGDSYANDTKWGGKTGGKHVSDLHGNGAVGRTKNRTGLKAKDLIMIPHRVALALQADGWTVRQDVVWAKGLSFCEHYAGSGTTGRVAQRLMRRAVLIERSAEYAQMAREQTQQLSLL